MRKLRLELERLAVETFDTAAAEEAAGTVQAHDAVTCAFESCTPYPSLHNTRCGCTPAFVG
jgi:hypothetical protein